MLALFTKRFAVRLSAAVCLLSCVWLAPSTVQAQDASPSVLWDDFNHYVLIARPDLAAASGEKLLSTAQPEALLDAVETSDFPDYLKMLDRAAQIEAVKPVADKLLAALRDAAMQRARDPQRIMNDIQQLAEGRRPAAEATRRLQAAGQFAAPQLLTVLEDDRQASLHPFVMRAMVAVGPQMVYPLSTAVPDLDPLTLGRVAQVLAELGYPQAIAPLKQVQERSNLDPAARRAVETALSKLLAEQTTPTNLDAAGQYLARGTSEFDQGTRGANPLGSDESTETGVLWRYDRGLVPVPVPLAIYPDVLAMSSAQSALALTTELDAALSLYLMSNFRRANRLPEGQTDPSYGSEMQSPMFYAMLAGPQRLHDVLQTALDNRDAALALDALQALGATSGTAALLAEDAGRQPMLEALSYPDRRVRFEGALALANARPTKLFPNAFRVVNVLAEAVRQGDSPVALVLSASQDNRNAMNVLLNDLGYDVIGGTSVAGVSEQLATLPGVDLIIVDANSAGVQTAIFESETDYRLASAPVLAVVSQTDYPTILPIANADERVFAVIDSGNTDDLRAEIEKVNQAFGGASITQEQATDYAGRSLAALHSIALGDSIYNVNAAQTALIFALDDSRELIIAGAADVLKLVNTAKAQQALADASFKQFGAMQVALLAALAESATHHGNLLTEDQSQQLTKLVADNTGELADAAARAHGALSLPTNQAVQLINQDAKP